MTEALALRHRVYSCFFIPFFDLSAFTDFDRSLELRSLIFPSCYKILINAKCLSSSDRICIQLPDQCLFICITSCSRTVFWRIRWRRYQMTCSIIYKHLIIKDSFFLHHRINIVLHELYITCIFIVFPAVLDDPRHSCRRPTPAETPTWACPTERIVLCMCHKAICWLFSCAFDTCIDFSCNTTWLSQRINIADQWSSTFCHIRRICRPVVHLQVNICMII